MIPKSRSLKSSVKSYVPLILFAGPRLFFAKEKIAGQGSGGKSESQALKANQRSYQFRLPIEAQTNSLDGH